MSPIGMACPEGSPWVDVGLGMEACEAGVDVAVGVEACEETGPVKLIDPVKLIESRYNVLYLWVRL